MIHRASVLVALVLAGCSDGTSTSEPRPDAPPQQPRADAARPDAARPDAPSPPDAVITVACSWAEIAPILTCAQDNCLNDLSVACVTAHCALLVLDLSPSCQQCVFAIVTSGNLNGATEECVSLPTM